MPYGDAVTDRSVRPEQWGAFLIGVFEEWVRHDVGEVYVQMFDVALANWYGEPAGLCVHSATCGSALALEYNGDVYSCDHFVEPEYLRGNIGERPLIELVGAPEQLQFGRDKLELLPRYCMECDVRFACHGGCPKDRFTTTPAGAVSAAGESLAGEPGLELPLPRLQGLLPPRRRADAAHVRAAARGPRAGGDRRAEPRGEYRRRRRP